MPVAVSLRPLKEPSGSEPDRQARKGEAACGLPPSVPNAQRGPEGDGLIRQQTALRSIELAVWVEGLNRRGASVIRTLV